MHKTSTRMARPMRFVAAWLVALGASAIPLVQVAACSCMEMPPGEAAAMADVAFTGTVVAEEPMAGPMGMEEARAIPVAVGAVPVGGGAVGAVAVTTEFDPAVTGGWSTMYTFEVDGVAKGDVGAEALVVAGGDGAGCGMSFSLGDRWLVFATQEGDALTTHLCAGNVPLADGEEPPLAVSAPGEGPAQEEGSGIPIGLLGPLAAVIAVAGVSAYAFWRADRPTVRG